MTKVRKNQVKMGVFEKKSDKNLKNFPGTLQN